METRENSWPITRWDVQTDKKWIDYRALHKIWPIGHTDGPCNGRHSLFSFFKFSDYIVFPILGLTVEQYRKKVFH